MHRSESSYLDTELARRIQKISVIRLESHCLLVKLQGRIQIIPAPSRHPLSMHTTLQGYNCKIIYLSCEIAASDAVQSRADLPDTT